MILKFFLVLCTILLTSLLWTILFPQPFSFILSCITGGVIGLFLSRNLKTKSSNDLKNKLFSKLNELKEKSNTATGAELDMVKEQIAKCNDVVVLLFYDELTEEELLKLQEFRALLKGGKL